MGEHGANGIVTADSLDKTRREDLLGELDGLQTGVWGVWRRLDDDRTARNDSWSDLPCDGQRQGEVPGNDASDDAQWLISRDDDSLIRLDLFLGLSTRLSAKSLHNRIKRPVSLPCPGLSDASTTAGR